MYSRHKARIVSLKSDPVELTLSSVSQTDLPCDLHEDHCDAIGIEKGRRRCPRAGAGAGQSSWQYIIPNQNQVSSAQASLLNLLFHR